MTIACLLMSCLTGGRPLPNINEVNEINAFCTTFDVIPNKQPFDHPQNTDDVVASSASVTRKATASSPRRKVRRLRHPIDDQQSCSTTTMVVIVK